MDRLGNPEVETFRDKSFALSDALLYIMKKIKPTPSEDCGYNDCKDCPNYYKISVKFRNYITESNSIDPVKEPYYEEEEYGGYCDFKIKNL